MKSGQKGFIHIILIVVVLIVGLGVGGYFVYQNLQTKEKLPIKEVTPITTSTPTQEEQPPEELTFEQDQMLDWKEYVSNSYSFMYPPDVELKEQGGGIVTLSKWGPTQKADTEFFDGISISFRVLNLPNTTLQDYIQSQIDEIKLAGMAEVTDGPNPITINNYSGLTYTTVGLGTHKTIVIQSAGGTSFVEITDSTVDPGNLGFSDTADKILNTFEFID
jgi:hypothetical protein